MLLRLDPCHEIDDKAQYDLRLCHLVNYKMLPRKIQSGASSSSKYGHAWPPENQDGGCVPIQDLHPSEAEFEGQLCHNATRRMTQFEGSMKARPSKDAVSKLGHSKSSFGDGIWW